MENIYTSELKALNLTVEDMAFMVDHTQLAAYAMPEAFDKLCRDSIDCYAVIKEAAKANKKIVQTSYRYAPDETMRVITIYFKF